MSAILFKSRFNFQRKQMDLKDSRIKLVNEVLNGIKVSDRALLLREDEPANKKETRGVTTPTAHDNSLFNVSY